MKEDLFNLGIKALIRNKEGQLLLFKVNPKELHNPFGEPYWDLPGGRIHRGDKVKDTLRREIEEETGIKRINSMKPLMMVLSPIRIPFGETDIGLILSIYICDVDEFKDLKLSAEHTEFSWFSPKEASALLEIKYPKEFTKKIAEL